MASHGNNGTNTTVNVLENALDAIEIQLQESTRHVEQLLGATPLVPADIEQAVRHVYELTTGFYALALQRVQVQEKEGSMTSADAVATREALKDEYTHELAVLGAKAHAVIDEQS